MKRYPIITFLAVVILLSSGLGICLTIVLERADYDVTTRVALAGSFLFFGVLSFIGGWLGCESRQTEKRGIHE